ncbi:MAG TPA: hypothetical protein VKY79_04915 [Actinomycetaceae bacterium]|nr:hypothetical protein [Actinomycetaceae bacterium]
MAEDDDEALLATVARELYGVVPGEFVAARNARAAELRRGGDRGLAGRVKALAKPSLAAWAVGVVVREEPGELDALAELGAELRVAQRTANPAELRALSRRRRELTRALTRTAARLADERSVPLSAAAQEQVEATWQAAVIDPDAERVVRSLLLGRTLDPGDLDALDDALAVPGAVPLAEPADDDEEVHVAPRPEPAPRRTISRRARPAEEAGGEAVSRRAISRRVRPAEEAGGEAVPRRAISRRVRPAEDEGGEAAPRRAISRRPRRTADAAPGSRSATRRQEPSGPPEPAAPPADVAREIRRVERELRFREKAADHAREQLEEAQEELTRVEARILQTASRLEELRRELEERETELAELDDERTAAEEEREDAEARAEQARRAVAELRERLVELSG